MKVAAGIVSYNPDLERLKENLNALTKQVSTIYIWDNSSENQKEIKRSLEQYFFNNAIILLCSVENAGLSVAYNKLATIAKGEGIDAFLLLDQDSVIGRGCVQRLSEVMEANKETTGIVAAHYIDRNQRDIDNKPECEGIQEVNRTITSGSLINLDAFSAVGGYDELLFVDWVDFDFCYRLTQNGFKILIDNSVHILHEIGHAEFWGYLPLRDQNGKWRRTPQYRSNHSYARRFDQARSIAIVYSKYRGTDLGEREKTLFIKSTITKLVVEHKKIEWLKARLLGWHAGKLAYRNSKR